MRQPDKNDLIMPLVLIANTVVELKLKWTRRADFCMEIDRIFEMLSWDNEEEIQAKGIEEDKKIKHLSVLIQPIESKSIWENCAKVLANKSDQELESYLIPLFEWLQDMNWPGAEIIYERLKMNPEQKIKASYDICFAKAELTEDAVWKNVLLDFYNDMQI